MMRATPYWSVSPSATIAYMPPRMIPETMMSTAITSLPRRSSRVARYFAVFQAGLGAIGSCVGFIEAGARP